MVHKNKQGAECTGDEMKKQNAIKTGKYQSQLEARIAKSLKRGMANVEYEPTTLEYTIRKHYVPDFVVRTRSGKTIYVECKGWYKIEDRIKMRAVKSSNPGIDIRMVFDKDNKVSSKGKMRYSEWCEKHGFKYGIKTVPKEWFDE